MSKRAEQRALEAYPVEIVGYTVECRVGAKPKPQDWNEERRKCFVEGYEQAEQDLADKAKYSSGWDGFFYGKGYEAAEKDFIALVKQYLAKGERCMEQEGESQIHAFWDGFHNCAENILRELKEE